METQAKFRIEIDTQVADLEDGQIGGVTHYDWVFMWRQDLGDENSMLSILAMLNFSRQWDIDVKHGFWAAGSFIQFWSKVKEFVNKL